MSEAVAWITRPRRLATGASYPEMPDRFEKALDRAFSTRWGQVRTRLPLGRTALRRLPDLVRAEAKGVEPLSADGLLQAATDLRRALVRREVDPATLIRAFALIGEATRRSVGFRYHPVQLMGGWAMLSGALAEMRTGEGKTITAALPAAVAALAGGPVHVVTVNPYLAGRDHALLQPVFAQLGLRAGLVGEDYQPEARREAYASDITYVTNKDVAFDYLRDRVELRRDGGATQPPILRGLGFAVIDEADGVLIDEARTPLILSASEPAGDGPNPVHLRALEIAAAMKEGPDYEYSAQTRAIHVSPRALAAIDAMPGEGLLAIRRARHELVVQALRALHVYQRDRDYIVTDGKVGIVDESTGRVMPDRAWEGGLHQLIEAKEGCAPTGGRHTIARLTYQRFFRRYLRLCGMTGTALEAAGELWSVYGLRVTPIPQHRPDRRRDLGSRLLPDASAKWAAVAAEAARVSAQGRPVLIGTRSVLASEEISAVLDGSGVAHQVLNARQDKEEADLIGRAGEAGRVTVATNMAGRGTDIHLPPPVVEAGGLHVILTEFHESPRVDRQLIGRCGRQGDPGSFSALVAEDDDVFRQWLPPNLAPALRRLGIGRLRSVVELLRRMAQWRAERHHGVVRRRTVDQDFRMERGLAFSGRSE